MTKKKERRELARFGKRGEFVRVFVETSGELVRVQWKARGSARLGTESWPNTAENRLTAVAWAEGRYAALIGGETERPEPVTIGALWERFADAEFPHLRPKSRELYRSYFRMWLKTWGEGFAAEHTTLEMVARFRAHLTHIGIGVTMAGKAIQTVKTVYAWAERHELITRNRVRLYRYKVAKEQRPAPMSEYRTDEFDRILSQFDPASPWHWRAWAVLTLCGTQGARVNAVLHLHPEDVALGFALIVDGKVTWAHGTIRWRPEWDKVGNDWSQPLRLAAQVAVEVALEWREATGYDGPYLFPPHRLDSKRVTYSVQALLLHLHHAEQAAGVPSVKGRGSHSLRRMAAGNMAELTGDPLLAMHSIGDTDLRYANRYLKRRDDRLTEAFALADRVTEQSDA